MSLDTGKKPGITHDVATTTAAAAIIAVIRGRNRQFPRALLRPPRLGSRRGYSQLAQPVPGLQGFI